MRLDTNLKFGDHCEPKYNINIRTKLGTYVPLNRKKIFGLLTSGELILVPGLV